MKSQEIINQLRGEMPLMRTRFGVEEIGLFGSYARNDMKANSDLDFLVKLQEPSFLKLAGLLNFLENKFNSKVDITTKHQHLSERFLKAIENEIIYA